MTRFIVVVVSMLSAALASTAAAQVPPGDSVTGSGAGGLGNLDAFRFVIDAHSGPSGESPTGTATLSPAFFGPFSWPVTCLAVTGNTGTLNFVVANPSAPSDRHVFTFTVTDSQAGDRLAQRFDVRAPTDCAPLPSSGETITFGDIVVVDAPAFPTSKEHCQNGGWRTFVVFKNQGDCVRFVATKSRNPPAAAATP